MKKEHQCVHYESSVEHGGDYVDATIDLSEWGMCHKCFEPFKHKAGVHIIRYVVQGSIFTQKNINTDIPF